MDIRGGPLACAPLDAALFRAAVMSDESAKALAAGSWPGANCDDVDRWCTWLADVWAQPAVAEAIDTASPALAVGVEDACRGSRPSVRRVRRLGLAVARYLVRMSRRATPFGLFAGVAPLRFDVEPVLRWTGSDRPYPRVDSVWLAAVVARLESMSSVRAALTVVANDLAMVRGERLVVPWRPHAHPPTETFLPAEVSVRHGRPVQAAVASAAAPVRFVDLVDSVVVALGLSRPGVEEMLAQLLTCGVLVSSLRPPATCTDGVAHLLDALNGIENTRVPAATDRTDDSTSDPSHGLVGDLRMIQAELGAARDADSSLGRPRLAALRERMRAVCAVVEQPLAVDLRLDCTAVLPELVAVEAAATAGALLRLTPHPAGNPSWRDYHHRFLAKFGESALVRVDQLVDPVIGLGYPAHFGVAEPPPTGGVSPRDEYLLQLAQRAAFDGQQEVVLDEAALDTMSAQTAGSWPEPHAEICVEVLAPSMAALSQGAFTLLVTGVSRTGAAMSGRFLDLLPEADRLRMIDVFRRLPPTAEGAVPVQLSFPPAHARLENVTRTPHVLADWVSLAEHRDSQRGRLPWTDLAVTANDEQLHLVSLSRGAVVEPLLTNAAARQTFPPLARLLHELPRASSGAVAPFSWGAASCLPFLPRVRHGRAVLAPARWRINPSDLPGPGAGDQEWADALARLRERSGLPRWVSTGRADVRLRLDLDERMDRDLLRAELDRAGALTALEAPGPDDYGWADGRAHEIVVPVATTAAPRPAPAIVTTPGPMPVSDATSGILPGSRVLFAKLYCHPDVVSTILTDHLPALLDAWGVPPQWWFIRYRDPASHLRLRLHVAPDADGVTDSYGRAAARVGAWAEQLRARRLIGDLVLDTYHPETARYGDGEALVAAEHLFAADSAAVVIQLAAQNANRALHPAALTAVSMVDLTCALLGGRQTGMRWLLENRRASGAPTQRPVLRQAIALSRTCDDEPAPNAAIPQLPAPLRAVWGVRRRAAERYAAQLAALPGLPASSEVLGSLLHLHYVRSHGIDSSAERTCHRLARAVALAWHNTGQHPPLDLARAEGP
ncbi:Lantibiotic dehydratase domain protein [Parafrankia sp. EAN1pec]|uniref:lantibiotic dehydratase n=1 Tax=Parafrankia sp. (strain EAN1pec) TaxID=298653 RepID=UPI0000541F95|nr:Lantibiotic dehydratase domain protein [Frankia sp. EAN1pec]